MAMKLRLARTGTKKRPHYRVVAADSRMPRDGRYTDQIGTYHPLLPRDHPQRVRIDLDRARDWLAKGAKPTDRVARMLEAAGVLEPRTRSNPQKARPRKAPPEGTAEAAGTDPAGSKAG